MSLPVAGSRNALKRNAMRFAAALLVSTGQPCRIVKASHEDPHMLDAADYVSWSTLASN
jgi:hypothetical protein